jgi:hypothetical protein
MLASDDANTQFTGARNPDDILAVNFYIKPVKDNFSSEKEGKPIFVDTVYVKIMTPGNNLNIIDTPAETRHQVRFPRQWAAFQNQQIQPVTGMPLSEWPAIERSRAEELKYMKFFTVEQIAGCSDLQAQSLGMDGHSLRERAKAFLATAKDTALPQAQAAEIERLKAEGKARDEAHAKEMAELRELIGKATAKPKRPYKRKAPEPQA